MKRFQINIINMILPVLFIVSMLFSCVRKDNFFSSNSPSTRKAVIEILDGGTPAIVKKNPIDFVNISQRLLAIDLRRDANDPADLNTTMTVVVKDDTAAAHAVNQNYVFMPSSWYTLDSESPKVGGVGGAFTFVFKPGEFAKQIYIVIPDATKLDPSALYGFGFTITSITGSGIISSSKSLVVEVGAKNVYDGIYTVVSGTVTRYTAPGVPAGDALSGSLGGNPDVYMITLGATTVGIPPSGSVGA